MKKLGKVILIDDSKAVNNRNESLLKSMNIFEEIIKYSDPKTALDFLKKESMENKTNLPDLIFLDLEMPQMDGFNFLDEYIEINSITESGYKPLVVILSAHLNCENFDKSKLYKSYGVLDHLKKPMDKEDILLLLEEHFKDYN